jgi:hypothetical protein
MHAGYNEDIHTLVEIHIAIAYIINSQRTLMLRNGQTDLGSHSFGCQTEVR